MATDLSSQLLRIALFQEKQRQVLWTARRCGPDKSLVHRPPEHSDHCRIASQHVETGSKAIHPVNEQSKMDSRTPGQDVPRHWTRAQVTINSGHDASQHHEEVAN